MFGYWELTSFVRNWEWEHGLPSLTQRFGHLLNVHCVWKLWASSPGRPRRGQGGSLSPEAHSAGGSQT